MRFPVNTGCAGILVSTVQNKAATHDPCAAAAGLWRAVSFNTALFMHSSVPLWLLYLSSVLWLLHRPPQLLSPARAYVTQETDLNTVSTVIVPLNTVHCLHCHRGPLSDILAQCRLSSESPGWPVQLWRTVIPSPVQHKSFSLPARRAERGNPYRVKWAHTWDNAVQCDGAARRAMFVKFSWVYVFGKTESGGTHTFWVKKQVNLSLKWKLNK